jgi:hypothetical protein
MQPISSDENKTIPHEISGSHGGDSEGDSLVGYSAV